MKRTFIAFAEFVSMVAVVAFGSFAISLAAPAGQAAAASGSDTVNKCKHTFLGLKPWYQYMGDSLNDGTPSDNPGLSADEAKKNVCDVKCFNVFTTEKANDCGKKSSDVPLVLLAIVDDLLRIAGLVALGFIIVGAFRYVASQGNPDSTAKAQDTIVNALLGLAISVTAVAFVSFIGNKLGG
jgi:hypothetical protein